MKAIEIRNLSEEEVTEQLEIQKAEYSRMRFNHKVSPLKNAIQLRNSRKLIARMLTVLGQKVEERAH